MNILDYWHKQPFDSLSYSYNPATNITTVIFSNGTVENCSGVHSCIIADQPIIEVSQRTWTFNGNPIAPVGATLGSDMQFGGPGLVNITINNQAEDGGLITVTGLQYGPSNIVYSLGDLMPGLSGVTWSNIVPDFNLNIGDTNNITAIPMPPTAVSMVYQFTAYLDSDPANTVQYIGEFTPQQNYELYYSIQSDNGSVATINASLKNNSTTAINGWVLAWTFPGNQTITSMSNASYSQNGTSVVVQNVGSSANIPANGGSVNFGFTLNYSGSNSVPATATLNGASCLVIPQLLPTPTPMPSPTTSPMSTPMPTPSPMASPTPSPGA